MGIAKRASRPFIAFALTGTVIAVLAAGAQAGKIKTDPDDDVSGEKESELALPDPEDSPPAAARERLGISIQTVDGDLAEALELKARNGALITSVTKNGPGDAAGLRRGDVILRWDDARIRDASDLQAALAGMRGGKEADVTLMRGIKTLELTVKAGPPRGDAEPEGGGDADGWDSEGSGGRIGLQVTEPDLALRRRYHTGSGSGVLVLRVEDGSRAKASGLKQGDFIMEAANHPVATAREMRQAVAKARKKGRLVLRVKRGEDVFYAVVRFG
jgi:serine protease Do